MINPQKNISNLRNYINMMSEEDQLAMKKLPQTSISRRGSSDGKLMKEQYSLLQLTQNLSNISRAGAKRAVAEILHHQMGSPSSRDSPSGEMPSSKKARVHDAHADSEEESLNDNENDGNKKFPEGQVGLDNYLDTDILCGRGGGTNSHPGNKLFRHQINVHRRAYLKARKNDKPAISRSIVQYMRERKGRFLKKDEKTGKWFEIGDDNAREKTSQALRQRAPQFRQILSSNEDSVIPKPHELLQARHFLQTRPGHETRMMNPSSNPDCSGMGNEHLDPSLSMQNQQAVHLSLAQLNSALQEKELLLSQLKTLKNQTPRMNSGFSIPSNDMSFMKPSRNDSNMMNMSHAYIQNNQSDPVMKKNMFMQQMPSVPEFELNPQLMYLQRQIPQWTTATLLGRGRTSMTPRGA